jgi:hypothetical protein
MADHKDKGTDTHEDHYDADEKYEGSTDAHSDGPASGPTDTHADHYDADGNYEGHTDSHTEPSSDFLGEVLDDVATAIPFVPSSSDE